MQYTRLLKSELSCGMGNYRGATAASLLVQYPYPRDHETETLPDQIKVLESHG